MTCSTRNNGGRGNQSLPPHKRGDSYSLTCVYKESGYPVSVEDINIRSQMRDGGDSLLTEFNVVKGDQVTDEGIFYLSPSDEDTSTWKPGTYYIDIEFEVDGVVTSTATMKQVVIKDITQ